MGTSVSQGSRFALWTDRRINQISRVPVRLQTSSQTSSPHTLQSNSLPAKEDQKNKPSKSSKERMKEGREERRKEGMKEGREEQTKEGTNEGMKKRKTCKLPALRSQAQTPIFVCGVYRLESFPYLLKMETLSQESSGGFLLGPARQSPSLCFLAGSTFDTSRLKHIN